MNYPEEIKAINIVRVAANNITILSGRMKKLQSDEKSKEIVQIIQNIADGINSIADDLLKGNKQDLGYQLLDQARWKYPEVLSYTPGDYQELCFEKYLSKEVSVLSPNHDGYVSEVQKV